MSDSRHPTSSATNATENTDTVTPTLCPTMFVPLTTGSSRIGNQLITADGSAPITVAPPAANASRSPSNIGKLAANGENTIDDISRPPKNVARHQPKRAAMMPPGIVEIENASAVPPMSRLAVALSMPYSSMISGNSGATAMKLSPMAICTHSRVPSTTKR